MKKILLSGATALFLMTTGSQAAGNSETAKLMEMAGKQRMLSQRLVKDYLYIGKDIAKSKAKVQLKSSLVAFQEGQKYILNVTNDENTRNLIDFVDMSLTDFTDIIAEEFHVDNAKIALDLSEALLEGSQFIVDDLKKSYGSAENEIIARSGKQGMLSQRIAKYYVAYQIGVKDQNTVEQTKKAVIEFTKTHEMLMKNESNTPEINKKLKQVDRLWKVVFKFYNNIEQGGLPFIVFTSTDKITLKMNQITELYAKAK